MDLVNRAYRPGLGGPGHAVAGWTHESALVSGPRLTLVQARGLWTADTEVLVLDGSVGGLAACVHLRRAGFDACIGLLAADPAQQGSGLGSRLLAAAERHALEVWGSDRACISVVAERSELVAYYQRRGYVRRGNEVGPYPASAGIGLPRRPGLGVIQMDKPLGA
ncbi:GNAT family N-acetyltransferase [Ideonella sp. DXS29W]|uniref:GNAT family N-acetyltransferase n=1 Tax=Ideonella lacteola TaxID=2984193 RepID=A0ABU9BZM2_9BURK